MTAAHKPPTYRYTRPRELGRGGRTRYPVAIVGAGPVGLSAAIDLATRGVRSVVLDDNNTVSVGSRAICWSKRTLEIFDRLGVAQRMLQKGVGWQIGRVYHHDRELYSFNLLPQRGHQMPAFINLQQYYVEEYLIERAAQFPDLIELRWRNQVRSVQQQEDAVRIEVSTPDGPYALEASWLIAADGASSTVREALHLAFDGETFEEKFLIADVRVEGDFPSERRFWFEPTFDNAASVLMHRQPDAVFRLDFQLGWDADASAERVPERVAERVRGVLGPHVTFDIEWSSVYTFRCARLDRLLHGRIAFAGDSAHVVSPFGARGGNGGVQDADNLCWKLAAVLNGEAPVRLIESYNVERRRACDENIRHSSRTTRFMTPKSPIERELRDAVLALAADFPFARALVNSGRLSQPCTFAGSDWLGGDDPRVAGPLVAGSPCTDAPIEGPDARRAWLLESLGRNFVAMTFASDARAALKCAEELSRLPVPVASLAILPADSRSFQTGAVKDAEGLVRERYGGAPGVTYLVRPDQHVGARFSTFDADAIRRAHARALRGAEA